MADDVRGHGRGVLRGALSERPARIIGLVMEGVHEEFRLAQRENK